ncbi:MAG: HD domain-containing phosphohydrolase [Thermodesulfobacteriota bacterium]
MDTKLILDYKKETGADFTESLTGLFNHGFFLAIFDQEIKRSKRNSEIFTLSFLNIDAFSDYNRLHGPVQADKALKQVADLIKNNIRDADLAARLQGDLFAILFNNTDAEQAQIGGERVRQSIEKQFNGDLTVSIGLVSFPRDGEGKEYLVEGAYEALTKAKISGKNRIHIFDKKEQKFIDGNRANILVVDDSHTSVKFLEARLLSMDYNIIKAYNGMEALNMVGKYEFDLILLDVMMPIMDGYEVCRRLKSDESTRMIPVIMVTALDDTKSKIKGIECGVNDFLTKPFNKEELLARTKSLINVRKLNKNLASIENILFSLANIVEAKDKNTEGHTKRVSSLAVALGEKLGLTENEVAALRIGGVLHDIGKIGVPRRILNKPGPLNDEERKIMMKHTVLGYNICLPLAKTIGPALDIIKHHHEKLCGSGYPDGLKGEEIPTTARVMAVVDIYDAITSERPYSKAVSREKAFQILLREVDEGELDKGIVNALIELLGKNSNEKSKTSCFQFVRSDTSSKAGGMKL